jgi:hypothetical protein
MITAKKRDDFSPDIVEVLGKRASYICSNPDCRSITLAPSQTVQDKFIYTGIAAHITAARPDGPRYDPNLKSHERRSIENGLFLCSGCATMIDKNKGADFPVALLIKWKRDHETWVNSNLNKFVYSLVQNLKTPLFNVQFDNGKQVVRIIKHRYSLAIETNEEVARARLAESTVRLDLQITNAGERPANDIHIFLKFPDNVRIYGEKQFMRLWELAPFDVFEDSEEFFRRWLGLTKVPAMAMQRVVESMTFEFYRSEIALLRKRPTGITGVDVALLKVEGSTVQFHIRKLKQNLSQALESLYVIFDKVNTLKSFGVNFRVNADERPVDIEGVLEINISKQYSESVKDKDTDD